MITLIFSNGRKRIYRNANFMQSDGNWINLYDNTASPKTWIASISQGSDIIVESASAKGVDDQNYHDVGEFAADNLKNLPASCLERIKKQLKDFDMRDWIWKPPG